MFQCVWDIGRWWDGMVDSPRCPETVCMAKPQRDVYNSETVMSNVIKQWNSIFTIYARPTDEDSTELGRMSGLHLPTRAVCTANIVLLKPHVGRDIETNLV
jgi:hypothetical protein